MAYNESYRTDPQIAFVGMVADQTPATIVSKTVETAAVGFGKAVKIGSVDGKVAASADGDTFVYGITVRSQATGAENADTYAVGQSASILILGSIFVTAGEAVTAGESVYVTVDGGAFGKTSGTGKVQIAGAMYETSGAQDDLVHVRMK